MKTNISSPTRSPKGCGITIAVDIAYDGEAALERAGINDYDVMVSTEALSSV